MVPMTGEVPKSTQAMFQSLMEDVEKLMTRKSQAQQEENEGRTKAMRMLRHLRDWIQVGVSGGGGRGVFYQNSSCCFVCRRCPVFCLCECVYVS